MQEDLFKNIIAHAKEYGFIFQSSEVYDGLSAVYDYGQNGVELKNNIKNYWWMQVMHDNIVSDHHFHASRIWRRWTRPASTRLLTTKIQKRGTGLTC